VAVYLDLQPTQDRALAERGIPRYVRELALALERVAPDAVQHHVLHRGRHVPDVFEPLLARGKVVFLDELDLRPGDVYHLASPFEELPIDELWPRAARRVGVGMVATLYDLIPDVYAEQYLRLPHVAYAYRVRQELVRLADRVAAISQATADDGRRRLGLDADRLRVVGAGVSPSFVRPASRAAAFTSVQLDLPAVESGYLLYTGGIEYRKNLPRLLEAYALLDSALRARHQLVVVCRVADAQRAALLGLADELGIADRLVLTGMVSDETLIALYQAADLFVFPSLYEGFGLPVAEAMACGAPVIAARTSSLTEVVRDEDALFDPTDPADIAAAIRRVLTDAAVATRLRAVALDPAYRWDSVAARTAEVYEELAIRRRAWSRPRVWPRLAVVTPLPPQPSGVADYSYRLLGRLARYGRIDAFVEDQVEAPRAPRGVRIHRLSSFDVADRAVGGYDQTLYCLGNSEFHAAALPLLAARPGVVLGHDVRFAGLYVWAADNRPELGLPTVGEAARQVYGLDEDDALDDPGRLGLLMARTIVARSERFLVHSSFAAALARHDVAPGDQAKIVEVPFGWPDPDEYLERAPQPALIATFGYVSAAKQVDAVVDAFAILAETELDARLAIVGTATDAERDRIGRRVRALGLAARVTLTGHVPPDRYRSWLARATVAVQLRATSNGETSAAIADCLAAGVPTIAAAVGSARELPPDVVVRVERDATPAALAGTVSGLLRDVDTRIALTAAGRRWAREHSIEQAAAAIAAQLGLAAQSP
jgi:glycosyltransferase involved in cell wall biosynthesis